MTPIDGPAREPDPLDPMIGIRAEMNVTLGVSTRWSVAWVSVIKVFAPLLVPLCGEDRVIRLAHWGALRLIRIRFDNGAWHWLRPEETDQ